MNTDSRRLWALRNNVHWYEVLCGIHGTLGKHHPAYWIHHGRVPPYMSNLLTLADVTHAQAQLAAIESLIRVDGKTEFSVKDAFGCLDLTPLGFEVLFRASWIYRSAQLPPPESPAPDSTRAALIWSAVRSAAELETWERVWRGTSANSTARRHSPVFLPRLLQNPNFHFLLGRRGAPVAVAALNRTEGVVGISNVFSAVEAERELFPGCVRLAHSLYPDLALVGYQRDSGLVAAMAAGFEPGHGLTVWNRGPR